MTRLNIKPLDIVIFIVFIVMTVISFITIKSKSQSKPVLIITADKTNYIYPLDKDNSYNIEGLIGISTITVKDGQAFFEDSPCPNKTCVQSGHISENGEWNACLPNQIFIRIQKEQTDIDVSAF